MNEKNFDILNKIIHTKKQTDNLLEQQILDYENSFEALDSDLQMENDEMNKNGLNIGKKNNNKNQTKNEDTLKEKEINGINKESLPQQKKISKNNNININIKKNTKKVKNNNNDDFKKYKNESKNSSKKTFNNTGKTKKKKVDSNSIDSINIEENKDLDKDYFSDNDYKKLKNGKKYNDNINKSIDYNRDEYDLDKNNIQVYNKVNIYQRMFDIKIKKYQNIKKNSKKGKIKFSSTSNMKRTLKKKPSSQEVLSENESLQSKKDIKRVGRKKINKNNSEMLINKKQNEKKEFLEDDMISNKSKKSGVKRQNSINSYKSNNSAEKFVQTYEKFKEMEKKKKEKLNYLRKIKQDKEKNNCYFSPKISDSSKNVKDDFFTRQKKKIEEQKKKNEELRMYLQKKREEEINRNNIMLKKGNAQKKFKMSEVNKKIDEFYEWETKRKEKISEKQRSIDESLNKDTHIPTINERSKKLATINFQKYIYETPYDHIKLSNKDTLIERLYKDDILKRKERQKILNDIYSPTFTPNLAKYINKRSADKKDSRLYSEKKKIKNNSINYNEERSYKNYSIDKNNFKNSSFYQNNSYNNSFADMIRTRLFKKLDKKRNNSAINLMKINEIKSEENINDTDKNIKTNSKDFLNINVKTIINNKEKRKKTKIRIRVKIRDIFENYRIKNEYLLNEEKNNKINVNRSIDF